MEPEAAENGGVGLNEDGQEEGLVTIKEFVEGLEAQELEVDMILGGDDGKECTYPKGYLPRQAVFSCISCCPEGNAGICTACSMSCHDGHEVIEIWTRRHFRCDCGNSKFGVGVCKLFSNKDTENSENVYNQNFKGVYCLCKRPYPDPDACEEMGEMLQCCICEDWFHEVHLGLAPTEEVPKDEDGEPLFDELICQACAASLEFLFHYEHLLMPVDRTIILHSNEDTSKVMAEPVLTVNEVILEEMVEVCETGDLVGDVACIGGSSSRNRIEQKVTSSLSSSNACQQQQATLSVKEHLGKILSNGGADPEDAVDPSILAQKLVYGEASGSSQLCKLVVKGDISNCGDSQSTISGAWTTRALFLSKNWRSQLCRCVSCLETYKEKGVSFLMDPEDTISKYEEVAKQRRKEKMDASNGQELTFLNNLSHVGKIEFLHGLNEMTSELSAFLASCDSAGTIITSADVYEFFDNLKKKRARRE